MKVMSFNRNRRFAILNTIFRLIIVVATVSQLYCVAYSHSLTDGPKYSIMVLMVLLIGLQFWSIRDNYHKYFV